MKFQKVNIITVIENKKDTKKDNENNRFQPISLTKHK